MLQYASRSKGLELRFQQGCGSVGAAIALSVAVSHSGLAADIAVLLNRLAGGDPYAALTVIVASRVITANLTTNTASAVFIFPIALSIADQLGVNFMPFSVALITGTVGATIIPASYQTNLMVCEPGEYKVLDFAKMGLPLTLLVGVVTVILAPIAFPFGK